MSEDRDEEGEDKRGQTERKLCRGGGGGGLPRDRRRRADQLTVPRNVMYKLTQAAIGLIFRSQIPIEAFQSTSQYK